MSYRVFALGMMFAAAAVVGCDSADETLETAPYTAPAGSPEAQALESARQVTGQAQQRAEGEVEASTENAQKLLDQAIQYINENKWDLAEQTLDQLDKIKASLPESMQSQVENARQLLETRRTAGNVGGAVEGLLGN